MVAYLLKKFPAFMAHEYLFPYSQKSAIGPIGPKPDDSNAHPPTPLI